jgi:hypothetical protein
MAKEGQRLEGTDRKVSEKMLEREHEEKGKERNGRPKRTSTARWLPSFLTSQHVRDAAPYLRKMKRPPFHIGYLAATEMLFGGTQHILAPTASKVISADPNSRGITTHLKNLTKSRGKLSEF